uniref:Transmembrane domain-containing protein n=1 Tax=Spironucleus salmonicida TaxID=348837 RepID=V6M3G4_9EUKA|eukprot:EST47829.1 Transmembrane domain-containing protein [Spironucleus salmonicida]
MLFTVFYIMLVLLFKQVVLDFGTQKIYYLPNKNIYFGLHGIVHALIVSCPWPFLVGHFAHICKIVIPNPRKLSFCCFLFEFLAHLHIDCAKRRIFKRNGFFRYSRGIRIVFHILDQFLHAISLSICCFFIAISSSAR